MRLKEAKDAQKSLEDAAKAADDGDMAKSDSSAADAKAKIDQAADKADDATKGRLTEISGDIDKESSAAPKPKSDAPDPKEDTPDVPEVTKKPNPVDRSNIPGADPKPGTTPVPDRPTKTDAPAPAAGGDVAPLSEEDFKKALDALLGADVPPAIQALVDTLVDELGEGIDPASVISRMDGKLRQWLEGKGFQNPEQMARAVIAMMQKPLQPGLGQ